jgi:TolB-like protein/Tfp pilus assembly protein PilF
MPDPETGPAPSPSSEELRLGSWKEIAAYLGRSTRTVQRWERLEGLPVHRLLHDKLGSVYAYRSELDTWWRERSPRLQEGVQQDDDDDEGAKLPAAQNKKMAPLLWGLVGLIAVSIVGFTLWRRRPSQAPAETPVRIAVLPFGNFTGDAGQDYLTDGFTEEMIAVLGRLHGRLGVIARTSVMRFKKTEKGVDEIGRELGVDYLLEGSVRRDGARVRLTAQLIRVNDETHLWAETYDRDVKDLLAVQSELARRIADEIRIQLAPTAEARLTRPPTGNAEAHLAYLRGQYALNTRTEAGFRQALEQFQDAIARDPAYAAAYARLGDTYTLMANWGVLPVPEAFPKAKAAVRRALELDADLPEAHASLAFILRNYDWDFAGAEREFRRALELNPSDGTAQAWYGLYLYSLGRFDEAGAVLRRAKDLDPLSSRASGQLAALSFAARRYDEAVAACRKLLDADPSDLGVQIDLARALAQKGSFDEAIVTARKAVTLSDEHPMSLAVLGYAYARAGKKDEARRMLGRLESLAARRYVAPYYRAVVYTGLGDNDLAMRWLEKVYEDRHVGILTLAIEPEFDGLRADPRFQDLLRRVGLPSPPVAAR